MKGRTHLQRRDQIPSRELNLGSIVERPTCHQSATSAYFVISTWHLVVVINHEKKTKAQTSSVCVTSFRIVLLPWKQKTKNKRKERKRQNVRSQTEIMSCSKWVPELKDNTFVVYPKQFKVVNLSKTLTWRIEPLKWLMAAHCFGKIGNEDCKEQIKCLLIELCTGYTWYCKMNINGPLRTKKVIIFN